MNLICFLLGFKFDSSILIAKLCLSLHLHYQHRQAMNFKDLHTLGLNPTFTEITYDCCELDLEEATKIEKTLKIL